MRDVPTWDRRRVTWGVAEMVSGLMPTLSPCMTLELRLGDGGETYHLKQAVGYLVPEAEIDKDADKD